MSRPSASSSSKPKKASSKSRKTGTSSAVAALAPASSPFVHLRTRMRLSIPPYFSGQQAGGLMGGAVEQLDSMVMRYHPTLGGVLLAHSNHRFTSDKALIQADCPFAIANVEFDVVLWAPKVGQKLVGTHSLSSPSHISLLLHKTFNVSIPLPHIPEDEFYFDASLAEAPPTPSPEPEDAEMADGEAGEGEGEGEGEEEEEKPKAEKPPPKEYSSGRWRAKASGAVLGEEPVEFTVVSLTVSSQMLSLTGSLLSEPFSVPATVNSGSAQTAPATTASSSSRRVVVRASSSPAPGAADDDDDSEADADSDDGATTKKKASSSSAAGEIDMSLRRAERKQKSKEDKLEKQKNKSKRAVAEEEAPAEPKRKKAKKGRGAEDGVLLA